MDRGSFGKDGKKMIVIYRITSIPSTNPSPIFQEDKNALNELCLFHFLKAFSDIRPTIHFIADHCTCLDMIKRLCFQYDYDFDITESSSGINQTMLDSYTIATKLDDFVLFQECDYLYRDVIGKTYLQALQELKLVSPYDHKNFYLDKSIHSEDCKIRLIDDVHFRTTERNTMTFGCHSSLIKENLFYFMREGYLDNEIWKELRIRGNPLWVPVPSFATHMAKDWLAPSVNWEEIWTSAKTQT